MNIRSFFGPEVLVFIVWCTCTPSAAATICDREILSNAEQLLTLHKGKGSPITIERRLKQLPSVKSLSGRKTWKVFEVWGRIDKARYRMHFIYAIYPSFGKSGCMMLGEEILDF